MIELEKFEKYCPQYKHLETLDSTATSLILKAVNNVGDLFVVKIPKSFILNMKDGPWRDLIDREIKFMKKINHENIATLVDVVEKRDDSFVALIMEYVDGFSLFDIIDQAKRRNEKFPTEVALYIAYCLCCAEQHMDDNHTVHRDICPQNIIVKKDGAVKLIDMDAAKDLSGTISTLPTHRIGRLSYISPEQLRAKDKVDTRADLYSIAAVLYEVLTLYQPFTGEDAEEVRNKVLSLDYKPLEKVQKKADREVAEIIDTCLTPHKDERYPNGSAMARKIQNVMQRYPARPKDRLARFLLTLFEDRYLPEDVDKDRKKSLAALKKIFKSLGYAFGLLVCAGILFMAFTNFKDRKDQSSNAESLVSSSILDTSGKPKAVGKLIKSRDAGSKLDGILLSQNGLTPLTNEEVSEIVSSLDLKVEGTYIFSINNPDGFNPRVTLAQRAGGTDQELLRVQKSLSEAFIGKKVSKKLIFLHD